MARTKIELESPPTQVKDFNHIWRTWLSNLYTRINGPFMVPSYTVVSAPSPTNWQGTGFSSIIYVSDETGGATLAFSDGTNWRRVQDRTIIA